MGSEQETSEEGIESLLVRWSAANERGRRRRERISRNVLAVSGLMLLMLAAAFTSPLIGHHASLAPLLILGCEVLFFFVSSTIAGALRPLPPDLIQELMVSQDARILPLLNEAVRFKDGAEQVLIRRRIMELTLWVGDHGGVQAAGPLLTLFEESLGTTRRQAGEALTRILGRLRPEDLAMLPPAGREELLGLLRPVFAGMHPGPALALLPLLPALDSRRTLYVIANLLCEGLSEEGQKVREAARAYFPALLAQASFGGKDRLGFWIERMRGELETTHWEQVSEPVLAILHLLPSLTPAEFQALLPVQRNRLYALMANSYLESPPLSQRLLRLWPPMVQAMLALIRQISDQKAVPYLERVTQGYGFGQQTKIRQAAFECLVALKEAKEQEAVGKVLLRASAAPQTLPAQLLRAAAPGTSEVQPTQLLRPDVNDRPSHVSSTRPAIRPSSQPVTSPVLETTETQAAGQQAGP